VLKGEFNVSLLEFHEWQTRLEHDTTLTAG
jgi:hypothetical protein